MKTLGKRMNGTRVAQVAVLLGLTVTGSPAFGQSRASLEASLAQVGTLLDDGRWEDAKGMLLSALEEHEGERYVPYYWTEIEEAVASSVYQIDHEPFEPADVVAGELLSWDPRSGKIRLRYRNGRGLAVTAKDAATRGDFIKAGKDFYVHPALFKDAYTIELSGEMAHHELPIVLVGFDWADGYGVFFGAGFTTAFEFEDGDSVVLHSTSSSRKGGKPYHLKVRFDAKSLSAHAGRKQLLKIKHQESEFGRFGFANLGGLDEVVITGEIEPSWISGLIDDAEQDAWDDFRERFDPFEVLPSWLAQQTEGTAERAADFGINAPGAPNLRNTTVLDKAKKLLDQGKIEKGLEYAKSLAGHGASPELCAWLLAVFSAHSGELEDSLRHCEKLLELDGDFYEARYLRAQLLVAEQSREEGIYALEELLLDQPEYVDTYELLALLHLIERRESDARKALEVAVDNGVSARALGKIGTSLLRVRHGPRWPSCDVYESRHYVVTSDMGRKVCYEIANELEKFYKKYNNHVERSRGGGKYPVFFFSGLSGYQTYCRDLLGGEAENELGRYYPSLKQLLVWNSPDKRMVMRTVRHEGFHQYLDSLTSEAPVWLNEGMAEYFEQAVLVRGRWKDDQLDEDHLRLLGAVGDDRTPLRELVYTDNWEFRAKSALHYAQAWAFVHFLHNGGRKVEKLLDDVLEALIAGESRKRSLDKVFSDLDWEELEDEFDVYIASLRAASTSERRR